MSRAAAPGQPSPHEVIDRLLTAIVADDQLTVSELAALPKEEIDSLRIRHSTRDGGARLEPEFTVVEGNRFTIAVWLPLPTPEGTLDIYSFDTFDVDDSRVIWHMTNAVPGLPYDHVRSQVSPRRPRPDIGQRGIGEPTPAAVAAAFNRAVFDDRDPAAVDRFVAEDYKQHAEWRGESGRGALKELVSFILSSPPPADQRPPRPLYETEQGNLVVIAANVGGIIAIDAYLARGGLLAEHWSGVDPRRRP